MTRAKIADIIAATAPMYGLTPAELMKQSRERKYCWPRQEVMAALVKEGRGIAEVGRHFDRDHTTVLNAMSSLSVRRHKNADVDYSFQEVLAVVRNMDAKARAQVMPVFRSVRGEHD